MATLGRQVCAGGSPSVPGRSPVPGCASAGVTATRDHQVALRQLEDVGFCILDGIVPADKVAAIRERAVATALKKDYLAGAAAEALRAGEPGAGELVGAAERFWTVHGLEHIYPSHNAAQESLAPFVADTLLLGVLRSAFDEQQLSVLTTTLQVNKPRSDQHIWHPDTNESAQKTWGSEGDAQRPLYINTLWFLTDFNPDKYVPPFFPGLTLNSLGC